ncbi:DNA glycosylase [Whalleya microplaca]|nr:DNA glycosylase [Whalleya microplaca]
MATRRSARLSAASELKSPTPAIPPAPPSRGRKRKAVSDEIGEEGGSMKNPKEETEAPAPTTPNKRRGRKPKAAAPPPPETPTPSTAKLLGEPAGAIPNGTTTTPKPKTAAITRLADPNATNAPLLSPETSRLVTRERAPTVSPSKAPTHRTTTTTILEEACAHLISVDARLKPLVERHHCRIFSPEGLSETIDPFESLCSGVISQQVSGAAAKAIKKRFIDLFHDEDGGDGGGSAFPHPSQVAPCTIERLRTAGLSQRKAEYVQGLAAKFATGELSAQLLADAPYEEVLEVLTAVRGLGRWSVEMFACFGLKRLDVFSLGDLGVQRGMAAFVGRDVAKLKKAGGGKGGGGKGGGKWKYMSEQEMLEISERFKPFRSVFMWYMWRVEETDISTLE